MTPFFGLMIFWLPEMTRPLWMTMRRPPMLETMLAASVGGTVMINLNCVMINLNCVMINLRPC